MPALRTLKLPGEFKWAWYTDPQCDGLESSPNLVFHVLFSNDEEVHQRLVTQALRAIPSEEIEYLESGESYSVPKRDVCRLLLSLLPSLKTLHIVHHDSTPALCGFQNLILLLKTRIVKHIPAMPELSLERFRLPAESESELTALVERLHILPAPGMHIALLVLALSTTQSPVAITC